MRLSNFISVRGARTHNLKSVDLDIPHNKISVITGPSGSGKSSIAFDTIYAEGQRRYVESLSSYARQFITNYSKPDIDSITGLSPAISIDQKTTSRNPRSTVGTMTEIYDYVRVLFASIGSPYSPITGKLMKRQSASSIIESVTSLPNDTKLRICAELVHKKVGSHSDILIDLQKKGFSRVKINGKLAELSIIPKLNPKNTYSIEVIIDRIVMTSDSVNRVANAVETAAELSNGVVHLDIVSLPNDMTKFEMRGGFTARVGETNIFSEKLICRESGFTVDIVEPRIFSFNSPYGACVDCHGLGREISFKKSLIVPDPSKTLIEGAIEPWYKRNARYYLQILKGLSKHVGFSLDEPFKDLPQNVKDIIFNGLPNEKVKVSFSEGHGVDVTRMYFIGVVADLKNIDDGDEDGAWEYGVGRYRDFVPCSSCNGYRLKPESLCFKIVGKNIGEVCSMSIDEACEWFSGIKDELSENQRKIASPLIKEITARLTFLLNVGLDYLTMLREADTLSGGEAQRIRLASQIGSGLCGVVYVLDEPSIGLHSSDNHKLISTLKYLRDLQNTIIVVEHDHDTILAADYVVDTGPGAGKNGGRIISRGSIEEIKNDPDSITGRFLSGKDEIAIPKTRRRYGKRQSLELYGASSNNLKSVNLTIPLGMFVVVTGVSGGGKSTLIIDTLYRALMMKMYDSSKMPGLHTQLLGWENISKVVQIDQSPIGRTPRSNPATYTGIFLLVRDWFAALPESRSRGYKSSRFSFNVKGGRCENCKGDGAIKIEMHFLPDVYVRCDICAGKRYNKETLEITSKGKNISEVLNMTVDDAMEFFSDIPSVKEKLDAMQKVGLGYMEIGQSSTTLSGGEAQRIKLSKELSRKTTGDALYILDEPTTGLHSIDIKRLLSVLQDLVDNGNTVLVIEHNIDVVKTADYVIDIGPAGGKRGGYIVSQGSPEEVANDKNSITGPFLKLSLEKS